MKKKMLAVAAMTLMLAGCSTGGGADSASPTPSESTASAEAEFLEQIRENSSDPDRATDEQWLAVGESVCEAYDAGASPNEIIDSMQDSSVTAEEAAAIVVFAPETLCPEHAG